jgi:hypothetical protein
MKQRRNFLAAAVLAAAAAGVGGCAGFGPPFANQTVAGAAPIPRVQNCAVLQTGTPSRFACNGKVYTSFQLAKLREDEAKRYASGR